MKRKMNVYVAVGILLISVSLCLKRIIFIPDFFNGFLIGIGIFLEIFGLYSMNHDISKIKCFKKNLFGLRLK